MKKLIIVLFILPVYVFSQKSEFEQIFRETKMRSDSSDIKSEDVERNIFILENLKLFRDKLLLNNNYKNKDRVKNLISNYSIYLPKDFNETKINSPETINKFYLQQEDIYYAKSSLILAKLLVEKAKTDLGNAANDLDKVDESLLTALQKANYPIEKYNKLTDKEKKELLQKLFSD